MRYLIILAATVSFGFGILKNNKQTFSGDPLLFPEELESYMSNVTENQKEVVDNFLKMWKEDSVFLSGKREQIIRLAQKLEAKNARPYPHYISYLGFYLNCKSHTISSGNYDNWVNGFEYYLDSKKQNTGLLIDLLEFSNYLIAENAIYKSASTTWKITSSDYKITSNKGLQVVVDKTDLICSTVIDSIQIFNTSGIVNPEEQNWAGNKGLVTWERSGFERNNVFANLTEYSIILSKSEYKATNVTFTNKTYFEKPLEGELHDKVKKIAVPEDADYPQFFSFTKTFKIQNLYQGINYEGGLSMQGIKLVGTGSREEPARLSIMRNDTLVLKAQSLYFGFKTDRIASESTSITILLAKDSIYHSDLNFLFRLDSRELVLLKTDRYSSQGPYSNSYHNLDMNVEQLSWRIDQDQMRLAPAKGSTIGNAYFESVNYFNYERFLDIQMMDRDHPLILVRSFGRKYGSDEFPVTALANYMKISVHEVKLLIMRLALEGFVFYDNNTELVTIKPKLHDFIAASVNKVDFDVMAFISRVEAPMENALFNMRTYDLSVNGINSIRVSDSQNVVIYPKDARIIIKKNRNFQFDGSIVAGLMTFYGKNLFFNYDSFKINMQNVDAVNIEYLTGQVDNFGLPRTESVENRIVHVTGEVLIDKSDNKSGRVSNPEYPIFKSRETSYVYYNSPAIFNGVYKANDFYFALDPFEMDSLDNFNAASMSFKGRFVSAGILPDIQQELSLQEDNSLGFKNITQPEGMPLYDGKGVFFSEIWLSNKGLRGNGSINYLTSTTWSDDFVFFPDSMNTNSQKFAIQRQVANIEYPVVHSTENYVHWEPKQDVLRAFNSPAKFTMFNDTTTLAGDLKLTPMVLSGSGRMDLKNSDLFSEEFTFKADQILADTSDFYLKSLKAEGFTVLTENVNSRIDYTQKKGWFRSNEGYSLVTFPENKYISYIDLFIWDMVGKQLAMGSKTEPELPEYTFEDLEPEGPRFISTDRLQDSLSFISPLAFYDYKNNYINATGVKFIEVADARIYPKDGLVTVQPDYKVKQLEDARIRANKTSKYHTLHTASIQINSQQKYNGSASYDYIDENDDIQAIYFDKVKVDTNLQTIASGLIALSSEFTLSPVYNYQGKVFLFADDSLLTFDGSAKIEHACEKFDPDWLYFETRIDPNDIYIPVQEESKNIDRAKIYNGMFMYYDSVHVYPAFLSKRKNYSDRPFIKPKGFLHYEKASQLYKIGSKEKINDFSLSEDYLSLHREDCRLYGEGKIDLGEDLGQVKLNTYGSFTHAIDENKTELNVNMGIDFFISDEMINLLGNEIDSFPNLDAVDLSQPVVKKTMNAWLGNEKATMVQTELNLFGTIKDLPKELQQTIIINELKLEWNNQTRSYQSVGKIGIASINGIQINKKMDGFFELRIKRSGDIMDLYLQLDRRTYYYFGYTRGIMQVLSSNRKFVETIMNMKIKERKLDTPRNQTPYNYLISTDRKKDNFYRRWQDIVSGNATGEEE